MSLWRDLHFGCKRFSWKVRATYALLAILAVSGIAICATFLAMFGLDMLRDTGL